MPHKHAKDSLRLTRRQWLTASLAAGLTASTFPRARGAQEGPISWVDAHVHVWTPDVTRYPLASGFSKESMQPASFTPEELMRHARPVGVGRVVLIQMSFYGTDNSYMLDVIAAQPKVYRGVAVIDARADDVEAQMRQLKTRGVRGFRLDGRELSEGDVLGHPGLQRMYRCGADEGLAMCWLINPALLPAVNQLSITHPRTTVVIDHCARIGVGGQIKGAEVDQLCRLARHANIFVKVSAFYALSASGPPYGDLAPMIRRLVDAYGAGRLMWASDCPFQVVDQTYADSINLVKSRLDFLSESARRAILAQTAERVYFA